MIDKWSTIRRELVRAAHCNITLRPYEEAHALIDEMARELADKLPLLTPAHAAVIAFAWKHRDNPNMETSRQLHEAVDAMRAQQATPTEPTP